MLFLTEAQILCIYVERNYHELGRSEALFKLFFFALFCFHFVFVYLLFFLGVMRQFINSYPCLIYGC